MYYYFTFYEDVDHYDRPNIPDYMPCGKVLKKLNDCNDLGESDYEKLPYFKLLHLLKPYKVPDCLTFTQLTTSGFYTVFRYTSKYYETIEDAMTDFHDVLKDSGINSPARFYENLEYMKNSTRLFTNFVKNRV